LGLTFFNSITKFLTILYFKSFATSFYLLFFPKCCTIPNNLKFFRQVPYWALTMNPKKHHLFEPFFIQLSPYEVQLPCFRTMKKIIFVHLNTNILQSTRWKSLMFFPHVFKLVYYINLFSTITCLKKQFKKKLVLVLEMKVFYCSWSKHSQGTYGVKKLKKFHQTPLVPHLLLFLTSFTFEMRLQKIFQSVYLLSFNDKQ